MTPLLGIAVDPRTTMTRTGCTVGTSVESGFSPHWSATFDDSYDDFGSNTSMLTDPAHNVFVNPPSPNPRRHRGRDLSFPRRQSTPSAWRRREALCGFCGGL